MTTLTPRGAAVMKPTRLADAFMPVRLRQVDPELRIRVADDLIRNRKLRGDEAILLRLAAVSPVENPVIEVPAAKYVSVIINRKIPVGAYPV